MKSRRDILKGGAAVAAASIMPTVPASAVAVTNAVSAAPPPLVGWSVGTEGAMNWEAVFAPTREDAIKEWLSIKGTCDGCPHDTGADDVCECYPDIDSHRSKAFDSYADADRVPDTAKHLDGWCNIDCDRCGWSSDETASEDVNYIVGNEIVCEGCMTLSDWKVSDPQYYDELIEELLTAEYGEKSDSV